MKEEKTISVRPIIKFFVVLTIFGLAVQAILAFGSWKAILSPQERWHSLRRRFQKLRAPEEEGELMRRLEASNDTKVILLWHKPGWLRGRPSVTHPKCGKCQVTEDKSMINNSATGAVAFFFSGISDDDMPSTKDRNPNQLHVFWTVEPPPIIAVAKRGRVVRSTYQFNATMSYRRTSDFYASYNRREADGTIRRNLSDSAILQMKSRGGLALVSNCDQLAGARMRMNVLRRIKSLGFPLDGYGRCFPSNESLEKGRKGIQRTKQYRFYFSFENSYHCRDYITEKLFRNAFHSAVAVPVVWGATRQDYESALPKNSFIFAEDFESPEKLVEYLQYLMKNDTAYLEYFKWHKADIPKLDGPFGGFGDGFCQMCRVIHGINIDDKHFPNYNASNPQRPLFSEEIAKRTSGSIHSYVFEEENKECNEQDERKLKIFNDWNLGE